MIGKYIKRLIKYVFFNLGYDIIKINKEKKSGLKEILYKYNINKVIDVGANEGQFTRYLRDIGYNGKIISFEPLLDIFKVLEKNMKDDPLWEGYNTALGSYNGKVLFNEAQSSLYSSILKPLPGLTKYKCSSSIINSYEVDIKRLDTIFNKIENHENVFLKIDSQGYEKEIISGAENIIRQVIGIQLETAILPLYESQESLLEMLALLNSIDFIVGLIEPVNFRNNLLSEIDIVFINKLFLDN